MLTRGAFQIRGLMVLGLAVLFFCLTGSPGISQTPPELPAASPEEDDADLVRVPPPPALAAAIARYRRNYADPALLAKEKRIEAISAAHQEAPIPIAQPSLASDAGQLLELHALLLIWKAALRSVLEEPDLPFTPDKLRQPRSRALIQAHDARAEFARGQVEAWAGAHPDLPPDLRAVLQGMIGSLSPGQSPGASPRNSPPPSLAQRLTERERRNAGTAEALQQLTDVLPSLIPNTRPYTGRRLILAMIPVIGDLLSQPRHREVGLPSAQSWQRTTREIVGMIIQVHFLIRRLQEFTQDPIALRNPARIGEEFESISVRLNNLLGEIDGHSRFEDDWPEFGQKSLDTLAEIRSSLVALGDRLTREAREAREAGPDPVPDDADECAGHFLKYPLPASGTLDPTP